MRPSRASSAVPRAVTLAVVPAVASVVDLAALLALVVVLAAVAASPPCRTFVVPEPSPPLPDGTLSLRANEGAY